MKSEPKDKALACESCMIKSEPKDKALARPARRLPPRMTPPDGVLDGRDGRVVASREKARGRR